MIIKKYTAKDSYKLFKEQFSDWKIVRDDINLFCEIFHGYTRFLIDKVLEGHDMDFPNGMGNLRIRGKRVKVYIDENGDVKGGTTNWAKTYKLWNSNPEAKKNKVMVMNDSPLYYTINWYKKGAKLQNKFLYSFKGSAIHKSILRDLIYEGQEYYERK